MAISSEEAKLELFLQWLKVNGAELRGCKIKYCSSSKGFGIFSSPDVSDEILMVVPLNLAITPMRVIEDPLIGPECRLMFEEGEVDDRFLLMLFLTVERLRQNSSWKPYLDVLPTVFGNPLWFGDDELLELKGTTLYLATEQQKKNLRTLFDEKVKKLAEKILSLDGNSEREVTFEDFLWANSIFWTRALNIPLPGSNVFPRTQQGKNIGENGKDLQIKAESDAPEDIVWIEGLVPGIDFCNHELKAAATWEVDGTGSTSGIAFSMYLLSAGNIKFQGEEEITISYGNKGNEELLYLYGFVLPDNPDDYLMIHYPFDALSDDPSSEAKIQLLEAQKSELRCLLPKSLLKNGFFAKSDVPGETTNDTTSMHCLNYSWSGQRKTPSYINKIVFPEDFLSSLRTIAMKESEIYQVSSLLEELVGCGGERLPSETEVRTATWEACGDSSALQLLVDLLKKKMSELEDGSGREENDLELLNRAHNEENADHQERSMSRNKWVSIVYRQGQKQLTRRFLKEAEHVLELALSEGN